MAKRSGLYLISLPRRRYVIGYRRIVGSHELICAKHCSDAHLSPAGDANVYADIAVTIAILD
jgi:hypothetical protein